MVDTRCVLIGLVALAAPVWADTPGKDVRQRQMTEVMFKSYPPRALAAGEQGAVFFIVTIDNNGQPTSCDVTHSSGYRLLDEETCNLIVQHGTFKAVVGPKGKLKQSTHEGVVNWTIPGKAPVAIKAIPLMSEGKPEKQVCKISQATGSLIAKNRQCMTRREWQRTAEEYQDYWNQYQGRWGSSNGG
jgi:TonB family protein